MLRWVIFIICKTGMMNKRKMWLQNARVIDKHEKAIKCNQLLTKTWYGGWETKLKTRFLFANKFWTVEREKPKFFLFFCYVQGIYILSENLKWKENIESFYQASLMFRGAHMTHNKGITSLNVPRDHMTLRWLQITNADDARAAMLTHPRCLWCASGLGNESPIV